MNMSSITKLDEIKRRSLVKQLFQSPARISILSFAILINRFGVQVIAVKELAPNPLNMIPTACFVIKDSDILIMLGPNESFDKLKEGN